MDAMATMILNARSLSVEFTRAERIAGLLGDIQVPLSAISSATLESDPLTAAGGLRAPGLAIPGRRKIGTWRGRGRRAAVSVRAGVPAVRLRLHGAKFDELLISSASAGAVVGSLQQHINSSRGTEQP